MLRTADPTHADFSRDMQRIFESYDADDDGHLNAAEIHRMLKQAFGPSSPVGLGPMELNSLCKGMIALGDKVTLEIFIDAIAVVVQKVRELVPSRRGTSQLPQKLAANAPEAHVDVHADLHA